jgi:hypothetical protein
MTSSTTQARGRFERLHISYNTLLAIYGVLPLFALVIFCDELLLDKALQGILPSNPYTWRLITIFLVYPHIIASTLTLFEEDYLSFYKNDIAKALTIALSLTFGLPLIASAQTQFLVLASYTVYHVMTQQVGIAAIMWGKPTKSFRLWKWLLLGQSLIAYIVIYSESGTVFGFTGDVVYGLIILFFPLFAFLTYRLTQRSETRPGAYYLWANCFMVLFVTYCLTQNYHFFAILGPRIIHDLSAFVFYVTHDHNRNRLASKNMIYRFFSSRIPIVLIGPMLAIALANLILSFEVHYWPARFLLAISFFHYGLEGFIWKRGSRHRNALAFNEAQWVLR